MAGCTDLNQSPFAVRRLAQPICRWKRPRMQRRPRLMRARRAVPIISQRESRRRRAQDTAIHDLRIENRSSAERRRGLIARVAWRSRQYREGEKQLECEPVAA